MTTYKSILIYGKNKIINTFLKETKEFYHVSHWEGINSVVLFIKFSDVISFINETQKVGLSLKLTI